MKQKADKIQTRRDFIKSTALGVGVLAISALAKEIISDKKNTSKPWWSNSEVIQKSRTIYPFKEAPGNWQMSSKTLISGKTTNLEIRYIHGKRLMPANSYHRICVEPLSVQSVFHCHPSKEYKIISYKGKIPHIDLEVGPVSGLGTTLKISFPKGLKAGESFAIAIGNDDGEGNIQATVNPVPMEDIPTMVFSNMTGENTNVNLKERGKMWTTLPGEISWFELGWTDKIPKTTIIADSASSLRIFGPTLVEAGKKFDLHIAVTDQFDSRCEPLYTGSVTIIKQKAVEGLPAKLIFDKSDLCSKVIKGLKISDPGIYRIKVRLDSNGEEFESNPIVVKSKVKESIYWGNIHNHNCYSECWGGTMDRFYSFARDISGLDFVSISDHIGAMPSQTAEYGRLLKWKMGRIIDQWQGWKDCIDTARKYNDPGQFVALVGYEWGDRSPEGRGYHMNVYYDDVQMVNIEKYFMAEKNKVAPMYNFLKNLDHVMYIPHKHGSNFKYDVLQTTVDKDGYPITPGIEVYSDWGDAFSPYGTWEVDSRFGGKRPKKFKSYQEAVDKGYKLSVISDSDSHTGLPGRRVAGGITYHHDHPQGITAVTTNDFTRSGIIRGYQKRKTYGTTGERIFLDVRAAGVGMGQTLKTDKPFQFKVEIAGTDVIKSVSLFDGMKLIEKKTPNKNDCNLVFDCPAPSDKERPYFVVVEQKDENRAWSTPIWVVQK